MIEAPAGLRRAIGQGREGPVQLEDVLFNDGIQLKTIDDEDGSVIDMDEGIQMDGDGYQAINPRNIMDLYGQQSWSFGNLNEAVEAGSNANSMRLEVDGDGFDAQSDRSDGVQHGSSASSRSMQGRLADFDAAEVDADFREPTPPPDLEEEEQMSFFDLHQDLRGMGGGGGIGMGGGIGAGDVGMRELEVKMPDLVGEGEEEEPEAMEIHVEGGEGWEGVRPEGVKKQAVREGYMGRGVA